MSSATTKKETALDRCQTDRISVTYDLDLQSTVSHVHAKEQDQSLASSKKQKIYKWMDKRTEKWTEMIALPGSLMQLVISSSATVQET